MHELTLLKNVRDILEQNALAQNYTKITQVTLEIGRLSCVEPEALRFCFDIVMKKSLAEGAELVIDELKGLGLCQSCYKQIEMESFYDACSYCNSPLVKVIQGAEMKIKDLVVI